MSLNLSGRGSSQTVALGVWTTGNSLIGKTANFTVSAASSASSTGNKTLTTLPLIKRNGTGNTTTVRMGFWVSGNGTVYYSADETGQTVDILVDQGSSSSITTFVNDATLKSNASLVGTFDYYTLPSVPASIAGQAGQTQATISWTAPANNGGTAITSYTLQRATDSGFTANLVTTTGITGTSAVVTGLTNGTPYYFRVAAVNAVATAASTTSAYATLAGTITPGAGATAPGQPTALTIGQQTPQTPYGLLLSWTAPSSNGGSAITAYSVKYSVNADMSSATTINTGSTGVSYSVNGLTPNNVYYFQVAAVNAIGTGLYTAITPSATIIPATTQYGVVKVWNAATSQWIVIV